MQPAIALIVPGKIQWYNPPQHTSGEREGFLSWLRGEFAAANAIIDALCRHLLAVGEAGEYDDVIGCVQRRRGSWEGVLHMQPYCSIAEVVQSLKRAGLRRQQQLRKVGGQKGHFATEEKANVEEEDEKNDFSEDFQVDSSSTRSENSTEDGEDIAAQGKKNLQVIPKTFVAHEIFDGKSVNVAEGVKLYENLFDDSEISKLLSLVNDLQTAGRKGMLKGRTFTASTRPMKGRGRETLQFGIPIADTFPEDEGPSDHKIEPMPALLQNTVEFLRSKQVIGFKPETCFIDVFDEGEHSQPQAWPRSYARPIITLFLTDCDMIFGRVISSAADRRRDYDGALKLSLLSGSVLAVQGNSADFSRRAIPCSKNRRVLVTFAKSQPGKMTGPVETCGPLANRISPMCFAAPRVPRPNGIFFPMAAVPGIAYPFSSSPRNVAAHGTGVFIPSGC